ncbi:MAG TPA: DUF1707 domain-containing protein [Conexibacter sp.]|jgi:hypothetical protein|nr:DUF1707 domain-containing protein [Conexibacter sp.]
MADAEQPTESGPAPTLRASDAERECTATLLRDHAAAGRLTPEELDERLDVAYAARTVGELDALVHDLPAGAGVLHPARRPARSAQREEARSRLLHVIGIAVLVSAAATAIWLATGADGSFWPKWLILIGAIRVAFSAWSELGPAGAGRAARDEARLGRGGVRPRELPREPGDER